MKLITFFNTANYKIKCNDLIEINNTIILFCKAKSVENVTEIFQQFCGLINNTMLQLNKRFAIYNAFKSHTYKKKWSNKLGRNFLKWVYEILNEDD